MTTWRILHELDRAQHATLDRVACCLIDYHTLPTLRVRSQVELVTQHSTVKSRRKLWQARCHPKTKDRRARGLS